MGRLSPSLYPRFIRVHPRLNFSASAGLPVHALSRGDGDCLNRAAKPSILRESMKAAGTKTKKELSAKARGELLESLEARFEKHPERHRRLEWARVQARLEANAGKLWSLAEMEKSGGEPDVVGEDQGTGEFVFFDCAPESPKGRVSVCYDREGLGSRKEHKPKTSALDLAAAKGIELLTEDQYLELQRLGEFDTKTSSWIMTPAEIRKLGGALRADRRYGRVFIGYNGAQSYYSARGFRGWLRV